jgi:hypothetical protein
MIKQELELLLLKEAMKKRDNEIELIKSRLENLEPKPRVKWPEWIQRYSVKG